MLDRYTISPLDVLWSEQTKLDIWQLVEVMAAWAKDAPPEVVQALGQSVQIDPILVAEEEKHTRHDVVAFLNVWRDTLPPEVAGWIHKGMTSSDLVDTANAVRLAHIGDEIERQLKVFGGALARHALDHWRTYRVARTHGQNAEVSTWGYRVADFAISTVRCQDMLRLGNYCARTAKLSGPVGNYAHAPVAAEAHFAHALNLNPALVATQVVMRDRLADFMYSLARIASCVEAFALEVRLGAHSQVGELSEGFKDGQAGSSAMPHKQNPILAEQLCGLAKVVRAQLDPIMQGIALWHERDISHSSVERLAVQTATTLTHYMLVKGTEMVNDLVVHKEVMAANVDAAGDATLSASIKDQLVSQGMHPSHAWSVVQEASSVPLLGLEEAVRMVLAQRYPQVVPVPFETPPRAPEADTAHVRTQLRSMAREQKNNSVSIFFASAGTEPDQPGWTDISKYFKDIKVDGDDPL